MNILPITNEVVWTNFFDMIGSPSFHQSWEWGEFQTMQGYQILRLGFYQREKLIGIALVIKIRSKRGNFLFVPHGPLFSFLHSALSIDVSSDEINTAKEGLGVLTEYLANIARAEDFWFIRIAPIFSDNDVNNEIFKIVGFKIAPIYMHAETVWIVDLSPSEDELLMSMRKNTRYAIRKASKIGVGIEKHFVISALDEFWKLYEKTTTRENFTPFPKKYIANEYTAFRKTNNSVFFLGRLPQILAQEGASKYLAGSLVIFTKSTGYYHQGASIHTEFPVPYLLQWSAMLEAKRRGCKYYNFYGIYRAGRTPKSWEGLSLFKRGFGGFELNYLPTQDYVVSPKYYFSYLVDRYLSYRRGI